jgi:hypothetical protein
MISLSTCSNSRRERGKAGARPGAKVFCNDLLSGDLAKLGVHLGRAHRMPFAGFVEILKQFVARQVAAGFDNARQTRVVDIAFVARPAFAPKAKPDVVPLNLCMPIAQSGQTKALVGSCVFVVADAKEGEFEKPDDRREHSLTRYAVPPQIGVDPGTINGSTRANNSILPYFAS